MTLRFYLPAASEQAAYAFRDGILSGRIPCLPEYLDPVEAAENFANYPSGHGMTLWCVERRTTDDGRIWVARVIDAAGSLAAALLITCVGPFAVGFASLWERWI